MVTRRWRKTMTAGLVLLWSLSVAAAPDRISTAIEHATASGALRLDGEVYHVQGLALDGPRLWVTSVDRVRGRGWLHAFDRRSGRLLRRIELTDGPRYHAGGIAIAGRSLWVPVAENRPDSSAVLVEIDTATGHIGRRIRVADHLGCVAARADTLVAGTWDSRRFVVVDLAHGNRLRSVPNPSPTHYQDIKFVGGELVAGGNLDWWSGSVDWLDWPSLRLRRSLHAGMMGAIRPFGRGGPWTGEGMAIEGQDLYLLPEDGPAHVYRFRIAAGLSGATA